MKRSAMNAVSRAANPVVVGVLRHAQSRGVAEQQPEGDRQDESQGDQQGEREPDHLVRPRSPIDHNPTVPDSWKMIAGTTKSVAMASGHSTRC
jgi:hypothetical protein